MISDKPRIKLHLFRFYKCWKSTKSLLPVIFDNFIFWERSLKNDAHKFSTGDRDPYLSVIGMI